MTGGCPFTDPQRLFQDLAATRAEGGLAYAGTFEARVVSRYDGIPEYRDSVLSLEERLANETMMTCVSRCRGHRLVLDL